MHAESTFELLGEARTDEHAVWHGALARVFRICRGLIESLNADIRSGMLPESFCARSKSFSSSESTYIQNDLRSLTESYPLTIESPFEGISTISGGMWRASEYIERNATDALLKLHFRGGTVDLPIHSHDHSDRVILVAKGTGFFEQPSGNAAGSRVISTEITLGDVLVFPRGTAHTFKVPSQDLVLLSYHTPFIELTDPRQYSVHEEPTTS